MSFPRNLGHTGWVGVNPQSIYTDQVRAILNNDDEEEDGGAFGGASAAFPQAPMFTQASQALWRNSMLLGTQQHPREPIVTNIGCRCLQCGREFSTRGGIDRHVCNGHVGGMKNIPSMSTLFEIIAKTLGTYFPKNELVSQCSVINAALNNKDPILSWVIDEYKTQNKKELGVPDILILLRARYERFFTNATAIKDRGLKWELWELAHKTGFMRVKQSKSGTDKQKPYVGIGMKRKKLDKEEALNELTVIEAIQSLDSQQMCRNEKDEDGNPQKRSRRTTPKNPHFTQRIIQMLASNYNIDCLCPHESATRALCNKCPACTERENVVTLMENMAKKGFLISKGGQFARVGDGYEPPPKAVEAPVCVEIELPPAVRTATAEDFAKIPDSDLSEMWQSVLKLCPDYYGFGGFQLDDGPYLTETADMISQLDEKDVSVSEIIKDWIAPPLEEKANHIFEHNLPEAHRQIIEYSFANMTSVFYNVLCDMSQNVDMITARDIALTRAIYVYELLTTRKVAFNNNIMERIDPFSLVHNV